MNFLKRNFKGFIFNLLILLAPAVSFAQKLYNPLTNENGTLSGFIVNILEGVVKIGIPVIALAIIYCGFLFVVAQGNPEKISKAKEALLYTLIGAAVLLGSLAIANLISATVLAL